MFSLLSQYRPSGVEDGPNRPADGRILSCGDGSVNGTGDKGLDICTISLAVRIQITRGDVRRIGVVSEQDGNECAHVGRIDGAIAVDVAPPKHAELRSCHVRRRITHAGLTDG